MKGLEVRDATVRYGELVAVDGVDLAVEPGEIVALLGASGSGKSSLLRGVAGLEPLAGGVVAWDGVDVSAVPVHARGFGMMFQDGQLFQHLSVAGNIGYGLYREARAQRRARVAELLDIVGLPGYGGRRVSELSGGQAQRVAIARALVATPAVVFADEPTGALDQATGSEVLAVLTGATAQAQAALVVVTHDPAVARTCSRVVEMRDGHVVADSRVSVR